MKILIDTPIAFSEMGERTNNEDTLYPAIGKGSVSDSLFLVCDGMGGADKGEEASRMVCEGLVGYFGQSVHFPIVKNSLETALSEIYTTFQSYLRQHPYVSKLGTTMALVQLHTKGVTIAHIGDSRVYHIRNGEIIFRTQDHRQVNEMVEAGIITAEQAKNHPWRNKLSKAIVVKGNLVQKIEQPDLIVRQDVQAGDYFFMCTDGVLEQVSEAELLKIVSSQDKVFGKMESIRNICKHKTKDNYSGYLIKILAVYSDE